MFCVGRRMTEADMQRRVDPDDHRSLVQAKGIIDDAFSSEGTDWFPAEQADLHDASSAMARLLDSLRQEAPVKAIAARIVVAAWQDLPQGIWTASRSATAFAESRTGWRAPSTTSDPDLGATVCPSYGTTLCSG